MGLTKIKFWLHLTTACGCTRLVEWPPGKSPPMHYIVALPRSLRSFEQSDMFTDGVLSESNRRRFELTEEVEVGPNEYMMKYNEIVAG